MKLFEIGIDMTAPAIKLDRKELSTIRGVLPLWLRGQDLKIAQEALRLINGINRGIVKVENIAVDFTYNFNLNDNKFISDLQYVIRTTDPEGIDLSPAGYALSVSYLGEPPEPGKKSALKENLVSVMPVEGLIALIKDTTRLGVSVDHQMPQRALEGSYVLEELVKFLERFQGNCTVTRLDGELGGEGNFVFELMAKNNHGRVFEFLIDRIG